MKTKGITKVSAFRTNDGQLFLNEDNAKNHQKFINFSEEFKNCRSIVNQHDSRLVYEWLIEYKDLVLSIY